MKKSVPIIIISLVLFCSCGVVTVHGQDCALGDQNCGDGSGNGGPSNTTSPTNTNQPYTVLAPLPGTTTNCDGTDSGANNDCTTTFQTYLPAMFNLSIGIAAALAFVMISYGGFELMTTDSIQGKMDGRKKVTDAVYGLILVIGAYAILYTINPQLLNFNLNIGTVNYGSLGSGTIAVPNSSGGTTNIPVASNNLNGYNIAAYDSGEPAQAALVQNIYNNNLLQQIPTTASGEDAYIQKYFPNAPITGAMITQAANQYGVDPKLMMAFMQTESGFGTTGKGAQTNNPGNIGNITNVQTNPYNTPQDGVNALASWLNSNRAK